MTSSIRNSIFSWSSQVFFVMATIRLSISPIFDPMQSFIKFSVALNAMDLNSFLIANALVGNPLNEGAIEFAYQGPLLKLIKGKTKIAITGNVFFKIWKTNKEILEGDCNRT